MKLTARSLCTKEANQSISFRVGTPVIIMASELRSRQVGQAADPPIKAKYNASVFGERDRRPMDLSTAGKSIDIYFEFSDTTIRSTDMPEQLGLLRLPFDVRR